MNEIHSLFNLILDSKTSEDFREMLSMTNYSQDALNRGLIYAIMNGKFLLIEYILEKGADCCYNNGEPLFLAISLLPHATVDYFYIINVLLSFGRNPTIRNGQAMIDIINQYPLVNEYVILDNVNLLLEYGYDSSFNNNIAIILAAEKQLWNIVLLLLKKGADIHARNDFVLNILKESKCNNLYYNNIMRTARLNERLASLI